MTNDLIHRAQDRLAKIAGKARAGSVLLCDTSASMSEHVGAKRRIDLLAEILSTVLSTVRVQSLYSFDSQVREIPISPNMRLPEPSGSTALHEALELVRGLPLKPTQIVVISDGEPDNPQTCIYWARVMQIPIAAYYCGADGNLAALAFMKDLAEAAGPGSVHGKFKLGEVKKVTQEVVRQITHVR